MQEKAGSLACINALYNYIDKLRRVETIDSGEVCSVLKNIYISLVMEKSTVEEDLEKLINSFSECDHLFFVAVLSRITSEEDHALLIKAIGNFGQFLSLSLQKYLNNDAIEYFSDLDATKVLFIIKGPFDLAHMSFAKSFLKGFILDKQKKVKPHFVFLDDNIPQEIKSISFNFTSLSTWHKLLKLKEIIDQYSFGTLVWPSVSQNISLYLGSRFTKQQIYWSARYRNSLFDTVDKYFFGARYSKQSVQYNGVSWDYGRFFVAEWQKLSIIDSSTNITNASDKMLKNFIQRKISQGFVICATISSDRKIKNNEFNLMILRLLKSNPHMYYFYTSRSKYCSLEKLLSDNYLQSRFKKIQWINCMTPILGLFDLILDSYPVGASHALCYAVKAKTPFVAMHSPENLQSSLLETIAPLIQKINIRPDELGFTKSKEDYFALAAKLCSLENRHLRMYLSDKQSNIIAQCLDNPNGMYRDFSSHILA